MSQILDILEPLTVTRRADGKYFVNEMDDEPLSRRQLTILMVSAGYELHEVAFMHHAFAEDPEARVAYFGILGTFMYASHK